MKNVQHGGNKTGNISILCVSVHPEDAAAVERMLGEGWSVASCSSVSAAAGEIAKHVFCVVLVDAVLDEGDWREVLRSCERAPAHPLAIVVSDRGDESLWAEVLNRGGYDLLVRPFDGSEVCRTVEMAARQWSRAMHDGARKPAAADLQFRYA